MTDDLPRTLIDIARAGMAPQAHDYPRPVERLGPIVPGRAPKDHAHRWAPSVQGEFWVCCECGEPR